jgi:hypothetical protein
MLLSDFFDPVLARRLSSIAYVFCGLVLLLNAFGFKKHSCTSSCTATGSTARFSSRTGSLLGRFFSHDYVTALLSGLCVGLHICPPMWAACFRAAESGNPVTGSLYFLLFYIGTLPFFLPVLGIPFVARKILSLKKIARIAQVLTGVYFLVFAGIVGVVFGG